MSHNTSHPHLNLPTLLKRKKEENLFNSKHHDSHSKLCVGHYSFFFVDFLAVVVMTEYVRLTVCLRGDMY